MSITEDRRSLQEALDNFNTIWEKWRSYADAIDDLRTLVNVTVGDETYSKLDKFTKDISDLFDAITV